MISAWLKISNTLSILLAFFFYYYYLHFLHLNIKFYSKWFACICSSVKGHCVCMNFVCIRDEP